MLGFGLISFTVVVIGQWTFIFFVLIDKRILLLESLFKFSVYVYIEVKSRWRADVDLFFSFDAIVRARPNLSDKAAGI